MAEDDLSSVAEDQVAILNDVSNRASAVLRIPTDLNDTGPNAPELSSDVSSAIAPRTQPINGRSEDDVKSMASPKVSSEGVKKKQANLAVTASNIKSAQAQQAAMRKSILDRIKMDKEARRQSKSTCKSQPSVAASVSAAITTSTPPSTTDQIQKVRKAGTESRLRLQTPSRVLQRTFVASSQLADVICFVQQESGRRVGKLETRMPRKVIWEEAKGEKQESGDREKGLERTVEEAVGAGSVALVVTFSAVKGTEERLS
jgi:hypothetical protein